MNIKTISFWGSIASFIGLAFAVYSLIATESTPSNTNDDGTQIVGGERNQNTVNRFDKPGTVNINPNPEIPKFEGEIGHYEKSKSFQDFIFKNQGKKVFIDAFYIPDSIDEISIINNSFGVDYLHLWENCSRELEVNEKPSSSKCKGIGYSIDRSNSSKDADMTYIRNQLSIKGYFAIKGCFGPHQGSMGCTLRPLNPEDIAVE